MLTRIQSLLRELDRGKVMLLIIGISQNWNFCKALFQVFAQTVSHCNGQWMGQNVLTLK